ncbi:SAV_2336 N-terminal domain-related protein [Streptomyces lydicus]|nr:SAV_2336 N-terminal domain-related protein [Streptomyces lydicus]
MPLGEPGPGPLDELVARLTAAGCRPTPAGWPTPSGSPSGSPGRHRADGPAAAGPDSHPGVRWSGSGHFPGGTGRLPGPQGRPRDTAGRQRQRQRRQPRHRGRGPVLVRPPGRRPAPGGRAAAHPGGTAPDPDRQRLGEVAVPIASAFPGLLPLQRALRPIQRYRPPVAPARRKLDEPATAELSAHAEMIIPVLRGVHRRAAALRLLMDGSSSMAVWEQMLHDLRQVCERVGAFRDVTVHYLHPHGQDIGVAAAPGPGRPLRPADQLHDPTGHHLTLVVSDCAGPLWRDGRMQRLLYRWAADAPLAVVQPLPQRMWARTLLPAVAAPSSAARAPTKPSASARPAVAGARRGTGRRARGAPQAAPSGPVRHPSALGSWARLAAADAGLSLRGAACVVRADHGAGQPVPPPEPERAAPARMVRAFDQQASPAARLLAVHLSAVPLALPVIQLVQRAMLPQTGPAELAEVLLSGLVTQLPAEEGTPGEQGGVSGPWYDFVPGVRDELLGRLSAGEAALVLKHCSLYIERTFGRSARNFPAVAVAMLSGSGREPETGQRAVPEPFARVSERVLRRFEPALRPPARRPYAPDGPAAEAPPSWSATEQGRAVRDLIEAVRLLRAATERLPVAGTDLARALLHAWAKWRQPDALRRRARGTRRERATAEGPPVTGRPPPPPARRSAPGR